MKDIKLLSKNKYLKVPLLYSGGGGGSDWREHLQPCEWLETDGNCYIELPYQVNSIDYFKINYKYNNNTNTPIFGCYIGNPKYHFFTQQILENQLYTRLFISSINYQHVENFVSGTDIKLIFDKNARKYNINGIDFNVNYSYPLDLNYNLYLFGLIHDNNVIYPANSDLIIYNCETNLFNLISCYVIDKYTDNKGNLCSAGVPGMVDVSTGIFYTNDGSGQFAHGGDIEI